MSLPARRSHATGAPSLVPPSRRSAPRASPPQHPGSPRGPRAPPGSARGTAAAAPRAPPCRAACSSTSAIIATASSPCHDGGLVLGLRLLDGRLRTGLVRRQRRLPCALARDGPLEALEHLGQCGTLLPQAPRRLSCSASLSDRAMCSTSCSRSTTCSSTALRGNSTLKLRHLLRRRLIALGKLLHRDGPPPNLPRALPRAASCAAASRLASRAPCSKRTGRRNARRPCGTLAINTLYRLRFRITNKALMKKDIFIFYGVFVARHHTLEIYREPTANQARTYHRYVNR